MEAVIAAPLWELVLHGRVQRGQPLRCLRLEANMVAHNLFRVPAQHDDNIHPAEGFDRHLGHANAPPLVLGRWARLAASRRAACLQPGIGFQEQPCSRISRKIRFLLTASPSLKRNWAQIRRSPPNGCSAFSAWICASTGALRWSTVGERRRLMAIPPRCFV